MTPKPPTATAKDLVRVALKLGFVFRRQSGSHAIYVRAGDQARVVIPIDKEGIQDESCNSSYRVAASFPSVGADARQTRRHMETGISLKFNG